MRLEVVDPLDDAAFGAWFDVLSASLTAERPGEPVLTLPEVREYARHQVSRRVTLLAAVEGGVTVGVGRLSLPTQDNLSLAQVVLAVHPAARRQQVGTALLGALGERARDAGRTTLTAEIDEPGGGVAAGRGFALAAGAHCDLMEARRDLRLPADPERLAALETACLPYAEGYQILTWRDRTPEHLLAERAALLHAMSTDVPMGDAPWGEEVWDAARVEQGEGVLLAQGRTWFTAAAAKGGRLVAFTDVGVPLDEPGRAYQWSTLVVRGHRGHRLGTLVKIAALRELVGASPRTRLVTTWNAESNTAMIAVNEALGFLPAGSLSLWSLGV